MSKKPYSSRTESSKDNWETPQYFFNLLDKEFNFTLDAAASNSKHKCKQYFTKEDNGLLQSWINEIVFCNPPYGNLEEWCYKAKREAYDLHNVSGIIVLLIPNRTDTRYWHEYCMLATEIRLVKGRIYFELNGRKQENTNFGSALVIYDSKNVLNVKYPALRTFYHKPKDILQFKDMRSYLK